MVEGYVFVSGGDRGIGRAVVLRFVRSGFYVVYSYLRNREAAEKTLEEIKRLGGDGFYVQMDVSDQSSVYEAYRVVADKIPYLNVLVNNAGILHVGGIEEV
ncbi:MAG: hypothetical protein B6U89_03610 [Desulfurococcales archaeon ex4484_58]|nr:MAG: hypothetical protein B6U89_03610 [Desulfurococcales archaeon ex4484_58]